jgi:hypothetical protein
MTLTDAESIVDEFNKLTLVEYAEVVAKSEGDCSVRLTATFRDSSIACKVLGAARIERDFGHRVYATLGDGNVPVFCDYETWLPWWEANPGGQVVKMEQSGDLVAEITFTGSSWERDGPPKFWAVRFHNTRTGLSAVLGTFATLEEAVAFLESIKGLSSQR